MPNIEYYENAYAKIKVVTPEQVSKIELNIFTINFLRSLFIEFEKPEFGDERLFPFMAWNGVKFSIDNSIEDYIIILPDGKTIDLNP